MTFHDGTKFDADAVIWNLDRFFKTDSPQFEAAGSGLMRARVPVMDSYRKVDDMTVAISTKVPASYFPFQAVYILFTSPASFEKAGHDWGRVALLPAAGTGPFRIETVVPRQSVTLARWDGYWDAGHKAKVGHILLLPIPEANTRLAALRGGQVDWIEVPPPDGIASLKQAGFVVTTGSYPHVWPWFYGLGENSPLQDVRVRQALNYCVDRDGLVSLLNGTAEPAVGWLKPSDPNFGHPHNHYGFDPAKGKALLAEAGYGPAKPLVVQGDDQQQRQRADGAAADERVPAGEPGPGLRREGRVRRGGVAGAADRQPLGPGQPGAAGRGGAERQLAVVGRRDHGALLRWRAAGRRPASTGSTGRTTSSRRR